MVWVVAGRDRQQVTAICRRLRHQKAVGTNHVKILTVGEVLAFFHANLPSGGRGRGGIVSRCAMEWRVANTLTPMIQHRHRPSNRRMLRDQARRTEEPSVPFVGPKWRTGSGIMLQSLLFRLPRLQERVANAVTFPTRYRGSHSSIPLENGEGVPVSGTYAPATGTHPSSRLGLRQSRTDSRSDVGVTQSS